MIHYLLNLSIIEQCINIIVSGIHKNTSIKYDVKVGDKFSKLIIKNGSSHIIYINIKVLNVKNGYITRIKYDTFYWQYTNRKLFNYHKKQTNLFIYDDVLLTCTSLKAIYCGASIYEPYTLIE